MPYSLRNRAALPIGSAQGLHIEPRRAVRDAPPAPSDQRLFEPRDGLEESPRKTGRIGGGKGFSGPVKVVLMRFLRFVRADVGCHLAAREAHWCQK